MTSRAPRVTFRGKGKTKSDRKRQARNNEQLGNARAFTDDSNVIPLPSKPVAPFAPKNRNQALYAKSIRSNIVTFGLGIFGTGKTYVAVRVGCEMFLAGKIERMIFSRPAMGAEEELGFFTGDINEKYANWVRPIRLILDATLGASRVEYLIKRDVISFQPFATMRGHSWPKTFTMLDEAQNTTPGQMKLFLSRTGEGSTVVVNGDPVDQKDHQNWSGIEDALQVLEGVPDVGITRFVIDDIVRSGFVKNLAIAYHDRDKRKGGNSTHEHHDAGLKRVCGNH